jgi:outer membrane protein insertion porin family
VPGEPLNVKRMEMFKKRLENTRYFVTTPDMGQPVEIKLVNRRPADQPYGPLPAFGVEEVIQTRLQDPGPELVDAPTVIIPPSDPLAPGPGPAGVVPFGSGGAFDPPPGRGPLPPQMQPGPVAGAPIDRNSGLPANPVGEGEPPGTFPTLPGGNMTNVGPDRNDPFPERSYADIVTQVEEAPTGRIMFGVGATSYGGLSGNFILHESNFDITAIPRSWREVTGGQAFRGAGQDFRVELSPGTLINRALVSFRDPYFLNLPRGYALGLGISGYGFSRFYNGQYNEYRGGGRFSLGSQFGTSTYADVAMRVEDVRISGFYMPAPADFLAVDGHTFLASLRPSIRFDNRNDPFAPNKGQYLEAAFEQGWGDFTFPKVTLEGRKYFTLGSRPDGSGKRILTFRGFFGISGEDTPVYERFYAGDFRSMRGFTYRGVGPFVLDRNVGGILSTIGSVEYQFPWTANDKLQQVFFCDFGTVESGYEFTTFRASVGTGLRVFLPQQVFGPLPLAFDFAFPVAKGPDDREQLFTFFIGAFW